MLFWAQVEGSVEHPDGAEQQLAGGDQAAGAGRARDAAALGHSDGRYIRKPLSDGLKLGDEENSRRGEQTTAHGAVTLRMVVYGWAERRPTTRACSSRRMASTRSRGRTGIT